MRIKKYPVYIFIAVFLVMTLISVGSCTSNTVSDVKNTEEKAREMAVDFVRNSPTFTFDGMEESFEYRETLYSNVAGAWQFVFHFESRHAGYGDRNGQMLAQVITPHKATVTVEQCKIKTAIMDGIWDMINQRMLLNDIEIKPAPIHEVKVSLLKSNPPQVSVDIQGGLPDGCTSYHDMDVTQEGNTIIIKITVQRPKDAFCPAIFTFFNKFINLGSEFTTGTTYTLKVNDYTTSFTY